MKHLIVTFQEPSLSKLACTALQELSFDAHLVANSEDQVNVIIRGDEITSAIEILQAYGGEFINEDHHSTALHAFQKSYNMDMSLLTDGEHEDEEFYDEGMEPIIPYLAELSHIDLYTGMGYYEFGTLEDDLEGLDEIDHEVKIIE